MVSSVPQPIRWRLRQVAKWAVVMSERPTRLRAWRFPIGRKRDGGYPVAVTAADAMHSGANKHRSTTHARPAVQPRLRSSDSFAGLSRLVVLLRALACPFGHPRFP